MPSLLPPSSDILYILDAFSDRTWSEGKNLDGTRVSRARTQGITARNSKDIWILFDKGRLAFIGFDLHFLAYLNFLFLEWLSDEKLYYDTLWV